jgi:large subunit ribosomal protein L30e
VSVDFSKSLTIAIKTGKVILGFKETLDFLRSGKAKLVVVAKNLPADMKVKLEQIANLAKTPMVEFEGSSIDLGAVCDKPYTVSTLTIRDPGDSDILKFIGTRKRRKVS